MSYPKVPTRRDEDDVTVHVATEVAAPISTVFEVIEDLELFVSLEAQTISVDYLTEHHRGLGVKTRWTMRDPKNGELWGSDEEIIHYDKPSQYAYVGNSRGRDYGGVHTLSENPDGSTHHEFNEVFHFDADPGAFDSTVRKMVDNVKKEAERRHLG